MDSSTTDSAMVSTGTENIVSTTYVYVNHIIIIINKKFWEELIAYFSLIPHGPHRNLKN
jgi:hypothetical protein